MKVFILLTTFFLTSFSYSQNDDYLIEAKLKTNKNLYKTFQKFYKDSIRQETKDEWGGPYYYEIDLVYGLHFLDYKNDGLEDVLVEFSATPSDSATMTFPIVVLFKNNNGTYYYYSHFNPGNAAFYRYSNLIFYFSFTGYNGTNKGEIEKYKIVKNKFISLNPN